DSLLEDPSGALTEILQLHVIAGEVDAAAAAAAVGTCVETLGGEVKVEEVDGGLTIGGAPISTTDLEASNGIIHVIDAVIVEPSTDC
ncbi:MAG: fasciclin domain-containing protein, partial [Microthrixaceae bacterium]|nr:fasciclin domain-containing protein [Microthrixaceae bacterium]